MKKLLLNLQLFGEGAGGSAATGSGADTGASEGISAANNAKVAASQKEDLSKVVYGKQTEDNIEADSGDDSDSPKDKSQMFEDLIKGEYKDEFTKRTQGIIDKRFRATKELESKLNSHNEIFNMLATKYGCDPDDIESITKSLNDDESFYEEEAMKQGLSVEQYKQLKSLEREVASFRQQQEEAETAQEAQKIYAGWQAEAEALSQKYGIEIDLEEEISNPDFMSLISSAGVTLEGAYKAVHFDDMMGGAMAFTAQNVKQKLADSVRSRSSRPSENGISPSNSKVFKNDPSKLTHADFEEIERRAARGEIISF